jgi:ABC-type multidrug transport system ATPase subunit
MLENIFKHEQGLKPIKETSEKRKKIIDNVTRFYVSVVKQGDEIGNRESTVLYNLLINIFRRESISWEVYIRDIIKDEINIDKVTEYLNHNLSVSDKIRILLSLIVMSYNDTDFSIKDITQILNFTRKFDIETDEFVVFFTAIENKSKIPVSLRCFIHLDSIENSIFGDYIFFGKNSKCNVSFANKSVHNFEFYMFMIEQFMFVGTSSAVNCFLNDIPIFNNMLYLVPHNSKITLAGIEFNYKTLFKIYKNQDKTEVLYLKQQDPKNLYDIIINHNQNRYSIYINNGDVIRNGKTKISKKQYYNLHYDDSFQINNNEEFTIIDIINEKREIGVNKEQPNHLFIDHFDEYFSINRKETNKSILEIELLENDNIVIHPTTKKAWNVYLNNNRLKEPQQLFLRTDIITINKGNFRISNFYELIEIPFELENINILDIKHYFREGDLGIDSVSFDMHKNEMIGILGPSGCGKSSLLKTLSGEILPSFGDVLFDGKSYFQNMQFFSQYIGYVPQEDLLFAHLTVYENLYYRGKLRISKISDDILNQKIDTILLKTNLIHKRNTKVGDITKKYLSGGERRRLNLGLELLFEPTILICDEPTSGLSFLDTEQIIEILADYSQQGNFVLLTIHQPRSEIFRQFDRVLFMDKGGKQVFFGKPDDIWSYFDNEFAITTVNKEKIQDKLNKKLPEYVNLIIEYPEYNDDGEIVHEKVGQNIIPKRMFTPDYWRDKFKKKILFELMQHETTLNAENDSSLKKKKRIDISTGVSQFITFFRRNFLMKCRNKTNLIVTFGSAPLLGFIISMILRLAPIDKPYSFNLNINIGIYIFISIIVFIFLGMSSSIEEIISERKSIIREKMLNMKVVNFLTSKILVLSIFSAVQIILYLVISKSILDIKGVYLIYFIYLFAATHIGNSIGLFFSTVLLDTKSSINILPLILIPQIIFGGAIIEFEKMNTQIRIEKTNPIPEVAHIMPSLYLFEGLYTGHAKLNPYEYRMTKLNNQRTKLTKSSDKNPTKMTEIYKKIGNTAKNYPAAKYSNEYLNLSVNMMDGKFLNQNKNVFLSSQKFLFRLKIPTYIYNLMILALISLFINTLSLLKLKFFYNE